MNIQELDAYNLDDAVKFNDRLNPRLWDAGEHLKPEVRARLLEIAEDFKQFLGLRDLDVQDITVSGSNAAYTYTPNSDIDLHIVAEFPEDEVYRELFDAKKAQYNDQHNITIGGADVELYVETAGKPPVSQGMYSVLNNNWIQVPRRVRADINDVSTKNKFETVGRSIERAVKSGDLKRLDRLARKIKRMRQTGLENHGEFGPENLAFKMLRSQGKIKELHDARVRAKDQLLSLKEKAPERPFINGFKTPATPKLIKAAPTLTVAENSASSLTDEEILKDFIKFCVAELKVKQMPTIKLRRDPEWSVRNRTFGRYINDQHLLEVSWGQRHIMDVLRTVAHELTHRHQHERDGERMGPDAGETGSPYENEANARAGILMRDYGRLHPELFDAGQAENLKEANPAQQLSLYNPDGTTYRQEKMPVFGPDDFYSDTNPRKRVDRLTHQDLANRTATDLVDPIEKTEQNIDKERLKAAIRASMSSLTSNETAVLNMRFWKDLTLAQTAKALNSSPERIRQIEAKALRKLRHESRSDRLEPFVKEGASGYIPTKKQARDPRFSMALTQDIRPGQLGKEANKLNLKTDKQGVPQTANPNGLFEQLMMEFNEANQAIQAPINNKARDSEQYVKFILAKHKLGRPLTRQEREFVRAHQLFGQKQVAEKKLFAFTESQQLDEVRMSPTTLRQWASSPEAQGIRAGFEAELIFRDTTNNGDSDYDMEPDYDADERCGSIQQIIDFFNNGEYGGLSQRQESRLQEGLDEQYMEWHDEQLHASWRDERDDLIREAWLREKPMTERIHAALVDGLELSDDEADAVIILQARRERGELKGSDLSDEQLEMARQYSEARSIADDVLDEDVEQTIAKEDGFYDEVLDEFRDGFFVDDDSGFFDDVGLRWMSDVANSYDLDWPYMSNGGGNDGSRDWEQIGDSLNGVVDMPVKVSSNYHSTTRREGQWIVEPDSSLEPDDREDYGLEIVSPPMPLLTALEKLQQVTDWANSSDGNAYTNGSTGLHMGVSVPFKGGDVDYLKLILFLGDEYVLQRFGREANTYTKSAMSKFRENIKGGRSDPMSVIKLMQHGLLELAHKEIQKGVGDGKYTSAHIQDGYIEFRSAGGDWLAEENADPEVLQNTMLRYARAMSLAANPAEERREYAKKLYKLVAPEGDSELALFSQFASGELTAEQLKKRWAEKTIGTEKKMNQRWKLYQNVDGRWEPVPSAEWNGYTEDQVKNAVWSKYGREALDTGEYQLVNMGEQDWEVYDVNSGATLEIVKGKSKGEVADAVYDKYVDQGIGFQVRPYVDPKTLTPRAKLAKAIVSQPAGPKVYTYYKWNVANPKTGENDNDYMTRERVFQTTKQVEKQNPRAGKYTNTIVGGGSAELTTSAEPRDIDNMTFDFRAKGSNEVIEQQTYNPENAEKWQARPVVAAIERANELSEKLGKPVVAYEVQPKQEPEQTVDTYQGKWEFFYAPTGRVLDAVNDASIMQARAVLADTQRRYNDLPADQIQMRKAGAVQDTDIDVAQNFAQPTTYQIFRQGQPSAMTTFQAATHPEAMAELERFRQAHSSTPPHEFSLRNLPVNESLNEKELGRLTIGGLTIIVDDHAMDRTVLRNVLPTDVDHTLRKLPGVKDQIQKIGDGQQFWIFDQVQDISLGMRCLNAEQARYVLKTVLDRRPYSSPTPVITVDAVNENFIDGKGPGRPGDSQRHGIPKGATMAELEQASHADGRKGELARWQLNMRRGHKK